MVNLRNTIFLCRNAFAFAFDVQSRLFLKLHLICTVANLFAYFLNILSVSLSQARLVMIFKRLVSLITTFRALHLLNVYPHLQFIVLFDTMLSHFGHFLHGPGFSSTFPLTINYIATILAYTSRQHITLES